MVTLTAPDGSEMRQRLWPRHCVAGSQGAKLHSDLVVKESDFLVYKGTADNVDSYSAFYDNAKLRKTALLDELRKREVTHLYLVGLALDVCVTFTALHAAEEGFATTVVLDGCRCVDPEDNDKKMLMLEKAGVTLCDSQKVKQRLNAAKVSDTVTALRGMERAKKVRHKPHGTHPQSLRLLSIRVQCTLRHMPR